MTATLAVAQVSEGLIVLALSTMATVAVALVGYALKKSVDLTAGLARVTAVMERLDREIEARHEDHERRLSIVEQVLVSRLPVFDKANIGLEPLVPASQQPDPTETAVPHLRGGQHP
ncbi:MAG: hypothetical protein IPM45_18110 [Acidimicrobiales bacterium]|nr:hypothetical protein [Acidimicrobiales bacterium]